MRGSDDRIKAWVGGAALAAAIVLPLAALVPLGWLWLWQHDLMMAWIAGALAVSALALCARSFALARLIEPVGATSESGATQPGDAQRRSPREMAAWAALDVLASNVDPKRITSREALADLGLDTVATIAGHMHPDLPDPLWNFTVPEALGLIERVSQRLRPLIIENVPLGDRLTVGQAMELYKWRGLVDVAGRAYDAWRVIRMLNPVSAATQEIRERLSRTMMDGLRDAVAKRLAAAFVRECGAAAIDLYSGRLQVLDTSAARDDGDRATAEIDGKAQPVSVLVAGRVGAGKSSLVNALAQEVRVVADVLPRTDAFTVHTITRDGVALVRLVDSPGIAAGGDIDAIAARAAASDLLVWVVAADRPDRDLDRRALAALRNWFAARPDRRRPPVLVIASHVDRLRPFHEWSPPYDIAAPTTPKARTMRDALDAVADDLQEPVGAIIPACLSPDRGLYNSDVIWARILELLPAAQGAQLLRRLADARAGVDWRRLAAQAAGAGRLAIDVLRGGGRRP